MKFKSIFLLFLILFGVAISKQNVGVLFPQSNCANQCEKKTTITSLSPLHLTLKKYQEGKWLYLWRQTSTRTISCCDSSSIVHYDQIIKPKTESYFLKSECDFVKISRDTIFVEGKGLCPVKLDTNRFFLESNENTLLLRRDTLIQEK